MDSAAHSSQQATELRDDSTSCPVSRRRQRCVRLASKNSFVVFTQRDNLWAKQAIFLFVRVAGSGWTPLHGAVMEKDAASVSTNSIQSFN